MEALASCRTLLSAEEVRSCEANRGEEFETRLAQVAEQLRKEEAEKTAREAERGRVDDETATSGQKESDAEKEHPKDSEVVEMDPSSGVS